mgnify:FL=1
MIVAEKRSVIMQIENVVNKNIDARNGNAQTESVGISDYIRDDVKSDCEKKAATVSASNSVDMSDTIYGKPQNKKDSKDKNIAEDMIDESSQSTENRRNEMVVVANTTTTDDYNSAKDDGYDVIVTETDKIKAVLAKAGVDISIYGDSLSEEQLSDITGNVAVATMISNQLKTYDVPATDENISDCQNAIMQAKQLENISQDTKAYMVKNAMQPTISNVYKATYSSMQGAAAQQNTKYEISDAQFENLKPQIYEILNDAKIEPNEENINQCRWLLNNQLDVTPENILLADKIDGIALNTGKTDDTFYAKSVAEAIALGGKAIDATMSQDGLVTDCAIKAENVLKEATPEDVISLETEKEPVTIENLAIAIETRKSQSDKSGSGKNNSNGNSRDTEQYNSSPDMIRAQRKLEEARLYMTAEANLSLLKKGISIDTEPIERVVEQLREQENKYYRAIFSDDSIKAADERVSAYENVTEVFEQLKQQPAYVLQPDSDQKTVNEIYTDGQKLQQSFEKASQGYETLMTAPRADMGDSISKAFQNVDDILKDIGMDTIDENRRAVRILAYNNTDITEQNISRIKAVDEQVQRAFKDMTPAVTVEMIKKGISPLNMTMQEISDTARQIKSENPDEKEQKYSEFLWKLEKQNGITNEQRESYIGIYRLITQVEMSDGAVIGALINQGADITMKNLLTAVRTKGKNRMDYKIDDDFSGIDTTSKVTHIDVQIETAYNTNCLRDIMDVISPEKMDFATDERWLDMTPEQLKQAVWDAKEDKVLSERYAQEQIRQFKEAVSSPENAYAFLEKYDFKTTASNLMAATRIIKNPSESVKKLWERGDNAVIRKLLDDTLEQFSEAVKTPVELAKAQEELAETAAHVMDNMIIENKETGSLDIRQMKLLCSQLRMASGMAKQENYIVPVETSDGSVTGVNLRIVRGEDKKGFVDIFMEDSLNGRIAATFEVKENGVSGTIITSEDSTRVLLEKNISAFAENIGNAENGPADLRVVCMQDISAENFITGGNSKKTAEQKAFDRNENKSYNVQTSRLYNIAEQFIVNISDMLDSDSQ